MRLLFIFILCLVTTVSAAEAASPNTPSQADDNNSSTNTVWYNARRGVPAAMNQVAVWYYTGTNVEKDYRKAYEWWSKAAQQQFPKSIANLGICYQYGRGVEKDSIAAIQLYLTSIEEGQQELLEQRQANTPNNLFDDMLVAACYQSGIGVPQNFDRAAELYAAAGDRGSIDGLLNAAAAYDLAGRSEKALEYYQKAAQQGSLQGAYHVAKTQLNGQLTGVDVPKQVQNLQKAADAGIQGAQTELGKYYLGINANGTGKDNHKAMQWLQKAAENGSPEAMWYYGTALKDANDYENALFWMAQSAQAVGPGHFQTYLQNLRPNDPFKTYVSGMRYYLIDNNYAAATTEFKNLDKAGAPEGKVMEYVVLGTVTNPQADMKKAAKELGKLSDKSYKAAYTLAKMYIEGRGVPRNTNQGISLLRRSANHGYGPSQNALANIYFDGRITSADRHTAADLYRKAYRQRHLDAEAAERLASMYETGSFGISMDKAMADKINNYQYVDVVAQLLQN